MQEPDERRRILKKLAKLVEQLAAEIEGDGPSEEPGAVETESTDIRVCTPKSLPDELQFNAARTAVRYNPLNAPMAMGALRALDADVEVLPPARIAVEVNRYWGAAQRTLTVSFMEQTSEELRNKILSHMNAWSKTAGISFRYVAQGGNVRITRALPGFWSYVGTDILHIRSDRPTMSLQGFTTRTSEDEYRRVVRHEAGHTLGFPHEHMRQELVSRLDPQKCYDYFRRTQGWDRQMVNQQVLTPLSKMSIYSTPADETSIMCYQLPGTLTRDGRPIKGGTDINATDYWFAGGIYPKAGAQSSPDARLAALQQESPQPAAQVDDEAASEDSGFTAEPLAL